MNVKSILLGTALTLVPAAPSLGRRPPRSSAV